MGRLNAAKGKEEYKRPGLVFLLMEAGCFCVDKLCCIKVNVFFDADSVSKQVYRQKPYKDSRRAEHCWVALKKEVARLVFLYTEEEETLQ